MTEAECAAEWLRHYGEKSADRRRWVLLSLIPASGEKVASLVIKKLNLSALDVLRVLHESHN